MRKTIKILKAISKTPLMPVFLGVSINHLFINKEITWYWILIFLITFFFGILFALEMKKEFKTNRV